MPSIPKDDAKEKVESGQHESSGAYLAPMMAFIKGKDKRPIWARARTRTVEAVKAVWWHLLITTGLGLFFIFDGEYFLQGHVQGIFIHIGGAFLVSAIVVFGYEWASKEKETALLQVQLLNILSGLSDHILEASADKAIGNAMQMLANDHASKFTRQFSEFALALGRIGQGGWARRAYMTFIEKFHHDLTEKAKILANLSDPSTGGDVAVEMPDGVQMADVLVNGVMMELINRGGQYLAVSDISTWSKDGLVDYAKSQSLAATSVDMKRLFVLGFESDKKIPPAEVKRIIDEHYRMACGQGSTYEMRITLADEYRQVRLQALEERHFGILVPKTGGEAIAIFVRNDAISNFRLTQATTKMCGEYAMVWSHSEPLPISSAASPAVSKQGIVQLEGPQLTVRSSKAVDSEIIINDYLLAYFIRRLPRDGSYRSISSLTEWREGHYDRLFYVSKKVLREKTFRMKRIFVIDDADRSEENIDRTAEVLRAHARLRRTNGQRYDWRARPKSKLPPDLQEELPFALLQSGSEESPAEVVTELAQPRKNFAASDPGKYGRVSELFDNLWRDLPPFEECLQEEMPDKAAWILERDSARTKNASRSGAEPSEPAEPPESHPT